MAETFSENSDTLVLKINYYIKTVFILFSVVLLSTPIPSLAIPADVNVCFTPGGNCAQQIINQINTENKSILVKG